MTDPHQSAPPLAAVDRRVGQSALAAFPVALGGAVFGWTLPSGRSTDMLDRFLELGGTFIDTADSYSSGVSEQIIGNWMRQRSIRDRIVLSTKIGRNANFLGLTPRTIRGAVDASLERLQTDHIDLLYFHSDDESVPIEESLAAAGDLIQEGKVRFLGASNYTAQRLLEARIASAAGLPTFEAVTLEYSLMRRDVVEGDLVKMADAQRMAVMPYFTLANGFLGRHRNIRSFNPNDIRARRASVHVGRHGTHVLRVLDKIAMAHGVDISAIAVAWVLAQPGMSVASIGPESMRELEALMNAPHIVLAPEQLSELSRASGEGQRARAASHKKVT